MKRVVLALTLLAIVPGRASAQPPTPDIAALTQALATARETGARMAAVAELGRVKDPKALDALLAALRDPNRDVRWTAVEALGEVGDRRAIQPLVQYLRRKEAYRWGKRLVANALGAIGGREGIDTLSALLADPDPFVRRCAALSLLRFEDPALLPRVAEVLRESPDDHLATVKREFAKVRDASVRRHAETAGPRAEQRPLPLRPHEWIGLKVGGSTLADARERLGAPLQATPDSLLFRGDQPGSPLRAESIVVNGTDEGRVESIFVFPVWGTLDRDVRSVLGNGRMLTYGEFLRLSGRNAFGAGTRADGKLHYLPSDLLTESFQEFGVLVVYDSADIAARDRIVKLVIVY